MNVLGVQSKPLIMLLVVGGVTVARHRRHGEPSQWGPIMNESNVQITTGGDDSPGAGAQPGAIGESGPPTEPLDMTAIFRARLGAGERDAYI